jgi:hypothetical protein
MYNRQQCTVPIKYRFISDSYLDNRCKIYFNSHQSRSNNKKITQEVPKPGHYYQDSVRSNHVLFFKKPEQNTQLIKTLIFPPSVMELR